MTVLAIVSLISLLGWLVLNIGAYRSHRISRQGTVKFVLLWIAMFGGLALLFQGLGF